MPRIIRRGPQSAQLWKVSYQVIRGNRWERPRVIRVVVVVTVVVVVSYSFLFSGEFVNIVNGT